MTEALERGYIVERTRGRRGVVGSTLYWVTKGSATSNPKEAGLFTRAEFESLHPATKAALEFTPVEKGDDRDE